MSIRFENFIFSRDPRVRILQHILFWVAHLFLFASLSEGSFWEHFSEIGILLLFKMAAVYPVLYYLFPRFLLQRRYAQFLLITAVLLVGISTIQHILYLRFNPEASNYGDVIMVASQVMISGYILSLALGLKFLKYINLQEKEFQNLAQAKLEAELKFLKAQIHPHFLFNTLNNLYTLTLQKSERAPLVVEKLSDLLRYMSYDANSPEVPLENEVAYLKNYVSLEKIRYGRKLDLAFTVSGDIKNKKIAPLILLPFVENSFKHGVSGEIEQGWITIHLHAGPESLALKVENSIPPPTEDETGYREGIGLKNVQRRLEILYKDNYELNIVREDSYLIELKLNLR